MFGVQITAMRYKAVKKKKKTQQNMKINVMHWFHRNSSRFTNRIKYVVGQCQSFLSLLRAACVLLLLFFFFDLMTELKYLNEKLTVKISNFSIRYENDIYSKYK